jgi:hypothetical protein
MAHVATPNTDDVMQKLVGKLYEWYMNPARQRLFSFMRGCAIST